MTPPNPDELLASLRDAFSKEPEPPTVAYLFGSVARGTARSDSDVDVAVLPSRPPASSLQARFALEGRLERALGRPVHLVFLDRAPADLIHRVLRDGLIAHEGDRSKRICFEVASRNAYFDLLPVLQRYRRMGAHGEPR